MPQQLVGIATRNERGKVECDVCHCEYDDPIAAAYCCHESD